MTDQKVNNLVMLKHKFVVKEARFSNNRKEGQNFKIDPKFSRQIVKLNQTDYEVGLRISLRDEPDNPFPFNLFVEVALITRFEEINKLSKEELKEYLNITALQILYPYARSAITNLTSAALVTPLILPIIDVQKFVEGSEFKVLDASK